MFVTGLSVTNDLKGAMLQEGIRTDVLKVEVFLVESKRVWVAMDSASR